MKYFLCLLLCLLKCFVILPSVMVLTVWADDRNGESANMAYLLDKAEHIDPQRIGGMKKNYHEFIEYFDKNRVNDQGSIGTEIIEFGKIVGMGVVAAVSYGIIHDLISTQINFDYFSSLHLMHHGRVTREYFPFVYHSESRILYAFLWGTIATWWVGLPLGGLSAVAARVGASLEKATWRDVAGSTVLMLVANLTIALISAGLSYSSTANSFLAVADMHSSSYFWGIIGGVLLPLMVYDNRPTVKTSPLTSPLKKQCEQFTKELAYLFKVYSEHSEIQALLELHMNSPRVCSGLTHEKNDSH